MEPLLSSPTEEAVRRIALGHLEEAAAASLRISDPSDETALHDFRVGIRRLRTDLRSYSEFLGKAVGKKLRRRLRDVARLTSRGRDAEVIRAWLAAERPRVNRREKVGIDWVGHRLGMRVEENSKNIRKAVSEFEAIAGKLRGRLSIYTAELRLMPRREESFAAELGSRLARQAANLEARLARIENPDDWSAAHRARLATKRLRYLVEPIAAPKSAARKLVIRLKSLQDLLGELHDAHVLEVEVFSWVKEAAAEQAEGLLAAALTPPEEETSEARRGRPWEVVRGLIGLAQANRSRRDGFFAELGNTWLSAGGGESFADEAGALVELLTGSQTKEESERQEASGQSEEPAPTSDSPEGAE